MCTIFAAVRAFEGAPLVVAANRDEMLDRASTGPRVWPGPPRFLAPRDEVAGGTWLGVNEHGLFVGVTNRARTPRDPARRSRGALVVDALSASSAAELHARLASLDGATYNGFHLFYADRDTAHVTWSDGTRLAQLEVAPGAFVVTERSFTAEAPVAMGPRAAPNPGPSRAPTREAWLREAWAREVAPRGPTPEAVRPLLARHADGDPFAGSCVHADAFGYGTRSSALLVLRDDLARSELFWAEGRPCETPFEPVTELAAVVGARASS